MSNLAKVEQNGGVSGGLAIRTMDDLSRVSTMLSKSGFFSDARDAAQCGVKVLAGLELGFGAFQSMTGIHIIKGKPSVGAGLMAQAVKASGKYNYKVRTMSPEKVAIEFFENGESIGVSEFDINQAKKAGTQNLDKFPQNMLFARAMSNGVRFFCPDVFGTSVYTPDELGAEVDENGDAISASAVEVMPNEQQPSSNNGYDKSSDTRPITDAQLKRMKAISGKHGWRDDVEAGKALIAEFGFESSSDITRNVYEPICDWLEKGPEAYRKAKNMNPTLDIPGMDVEEPDYHPDGGKAIEAAVQHADYVDAESGDNF